MEMFQSILTFVIGIAVVLFVFKTIGECLLPTREERMEAERREMIQAPRQPKMEYKETDEWDELCDGWLERMWVESAFSARYDRERKEAKQARMAMRAEMEYQKYKRRRDAGGDMRAWLKILDNR